MYHRAELIISPGHRGECVGLFQSCDEFKNPAELRAFAGYAQLELVELWLPREEGLKCEIVFLNLLRYGRSWSEPVLLDMLDALALKYPDDWRGKKCRTLREEIRSALLNAEAGEQDGGYSRLAKDSSSTGDKQGAARTAEMWIDEAGDNLDELALRITLAVFHGTTFETIEAAKNDLLEMLRELVQTPPPNPEAPPPPPAPHVPLMRRLQKAGASERQGRPPDGETVIELKEPVAAEAITYVWRLYREAKWRQKLMEWLTAYAAGRRADVRARAAVAVGILATKDYRFVRDKLLAAWVQAPVNSSQYRTAIGMALGILVREESWVAEVQSLLRGWSRSPDPAERWAALRAYIYVGASCRPVKEVIAGWRDIAAFAVTTSESVTIYVEDSEHKVVQLKPMLMSLMDAMMRFFVDVAQMPTEEKRPRFASILEGLREWVEGSKADVGLGLFMFTTLGQLVVGAAVEGEADGAPVLLQLLPDGPGEDAAGYRSQLAGLIEVLMRNGATITDARELLCAWLGWVNRLPDNPRLYEERIRALLNEIIAADKSGRARGKLAVCLRDCGRNRTAQSILSGL